MQFEQPLSPSAFSFLNQDMLTDFADPASSDSAASSSGIDLFKYYLDLNSAAQKEQQQQQSISTPTGAPTTLSLQDIESFQSFLNSSAQAPPSLPSTSSYYPFAEASTSASSSSAFSAAQTPSAAAGNATGSLPPSAFEPSSINHGSDLPIDPRYLNTSPPQQQQQQASSSVRESAVKLEPVEEHEHQPSAAGKRTTRKRAVSELALDDTSEGSEESEEEEDDDDEDLNASDMETVPGPRKSARKNAASTSKRGGSGSKKSTSSKKKSSPAASSSASTSLSAAMVHPHALVPVPEYADRPSKAEYDKLSSKEKRQLRNKISARNFRHRRKAHIDTLEGEIAVKDGMIGTLREEVGTLRSENQGLRADIELLKKNWESIAAKISASASATTASAPTPSASTSTSTLSNNAFFLTPDEDDLYGAGSLPALSPDSSSASTSGDAESLLFDGASASAASTSASSSSTAHSKPLAQPLSQPARRTGTRSSTRPNTRKDISPSTGGAFWAGNGGAFGGAGNVGVHTTFVPEFTLAGSPAASLQSHLSPADLAGKLGRDGTTAAGGMFAYGGNVNPGLNGLSDAQRALLREGMPALSPAPFNGPANTNTATTDADLAASGVRKPDPIRDGFFESNPFLLLRNDAMQDYRGQLYSKLAHNLAGIQASTAAAKSGAAPPAGLRPAFFAQPPTSASASAAGDRASEEEQVAKAVGALATKTLFEKLSTAFWDAFAGEQPGHKHILPGGGKKELDGKKIADVIGGRSRLVVVPVEENEKEGRDVDSLEKELAKLDIVKKH